MDPRDKPTITERLRDLITHEVKESGYRETATTTGVTRSTLGYLVQGGRPSIETVEKLVAHYSLELKESNE